MSFDTGYAGGGGGLNPGCGVCGGLYSAGGGTLLPGMSIVGCSKGLTLGGIEGLTSVTGGSITDVSAATSEVPSCVQNVNHSSVNV